jgi:hypothetical protein
MQHKTKTGQRKEASPPRYHAYHVAKRADKFYCTKIGAAWSHEDGEGLNIDLNLFPINGGGIVLRAPKGRPGLTLT